MGRLPIHVVRRIRTSLEREGDPEEAAYLAGPGSEGGIGHRQRAMSNQSPKKRQGERATPRPFDEAVKATPEVKPLEKSAKRPRQRKRTKG